MKKLDATGLNVIIESLNVLRCPQCGDETTEKEILEKCSYGYMPYCYCQFDPTGEQGDRTFTEYVKAVNFSRRAN